MFSVATNGVDPPLRSTRQTGFTFAIAFTVDESVAGAMPLCRSTGECEFGCKVPDLSNELEY